MTVTFYFMRHGETFLNKYRRMQGWANAPLTDYGKAMCRASGRGLSMVKFDKVYTSDLQRTKDTAELIMAENKVSSDMTFVEKSEFREIFFGTFEGLPVDDIWPDLIQQYGNDTPSILNRLHQMDPTGDAENYMTFWLRIEKGLYELLQSHKDTNQTILVVSHGMAIKTMLQGIISDFNCEGTLDNASVCKVRYENGQFHLDSINDTTHFK